MQADIDWMPSNRNPSLPMQEPHALEQLIRSFSRLPGLGPRSARRLVLELIRKRESVMHPLIRHLQQVAEYIVTCDICGNLDAQAPCTICCDTRRDPSLLCVVEDLGDLWAIERSRLYTGRYHVLGGVLSAMDGIGPSQLGIERLAERAGAPEVAEVILATNATVDGQTTAHYIAERLAGLELRITRLAQGIPMGGELDYLDDGTLGTAIRARLPA